MELWAALRSRLCVLTGVFCYRNLHIRYSDWTEKMRFLVLLAVATMTRAAVRRCPPPELNFFRKALEDFVTEMDRFADDAVGRRLGNGAAFYGKRKSTFYGTDDAQRKVDPDAVDREEDYSGPGGGSYFVLSKERDEEGRPLGFLTRKEARVQAQRDRDAMLEAAAESQGISEAFLAGLTSSCEDEAQPAERVADAGSSGSSMIAQSSWAVVGDVLHASKPARAVCERLEAAGKTVHRVNPRDRTGTLPKSLMDVSAQIDVVDLIINPKEGLQVVEEAAALGIRRVFIQPGAGSLDIEQFCESHNVQFHHGCVLREL